MTMRRKRPPRISRSATGWLRSLRGRLPWRRSLAALLPLGLLLLTLLASSGQARPAAESAGEAATESASETRAESPARILLREEREAARKAKREAKHPPERERNNVVIHVSCTQVTWAFRNFPDLPGNTVVQKLKVDHVNTWSTFTFDGPTGTSTMQINAPPGKFKIDTWGKWRTNGVRGSFDIGIGTQCAPKPAFTVEKLQKIDGGGGAYTPTTLTGQVGQTIDYEILVRNSGNVPLTFASLSDPRCDAGTIAGGPGGEALAAGATTTFTCTHLLTAADLTAGSISNSVTLTGTPPEGQGSPVEHPSNTVLTEVQPEPPAKEPPAKEAPAKEPPTTTTTTTPSSGTAGSTSTQTPRSGVLAVTQSSVPALKVTLPKLTGPQGCVRSSFRASIKSAHVASVTFYMDGHKLRTLTARNARKGLLAITIDPAKLRVGPHKLTAKITMAKTSSSAKAVHGTRSATVLRCRPAVLTPKFTG